MEEKKKVNYKTIERRYKRSYDSRTVEGLIRGALLGAAWGVYFPHPYYAGNMLKQTFNTTKEVPSTGNVSGGTIGNELAIQSLKLPLFLRFRNRMKNVGKSSLTMSLFLGTYSGMTCVAEQFTKLEPYHFVNMFIGGSSACLLLHVGFPGTMDRKQHLKHIRYVMRSKKILLPITVLPGLFAAALYMYN